MRVHAINKGSDEWRQAGETGLFEFSSFEVDFGSIVLWGGNKFDPKSYFAVFIWKDCPLSIEKGMPSSLLLVLFIIANKWEMEHN